MRNVDLNTIVRELEAQKLRKRDLVVPAKWLKMEHDGNIVLHETIDRKLPKEMYDYLDGIGIHADEFDTSLQYPFKPTLACEQQIADKLNIPWKYYERMRNTAPSLLKLNVDYWLNSNGNGKNYFLRTFAPIRETDVGVARAFLGERFNVIDHIDVLIAVLDTIRETGANVKISGCDVTDKRLYVRFSAPDIIKRAPELLKHYRSPDGNRDDGIISGFVLSNSETGHGKFKISPRATVLACMNGLIHERDAIGVVHMGSKMQEGVIEWSELTKQKELELIISQAKDAVKKFLSVDYLDTLVDRLENNGTKELEHPISAVTNICGSLSLSNERKDDVLKYFSKSGDITAFGAVQSLTYYAHEEENADLAYDLESSAIGVVENIDKFDIPEIPRQYRKSEKGS